MSTSPSLNSRAAVAGPRPELVALLRSTVAAISWRPALVTGLLAVGLVVERRLRAPGGIVPDPALYAAMVLLAVGHTAVLDDPTEPEVSSVPVPRRFRSAARLGVASTRWVCGWVAVVAVASSGQAAVDWPAATLVAAVLLLAAVTAGALTDSATAATAIVGLLVALWFLPSALVMVVPLDHGGIAAGRWLLLGAGTVALLAWHERDRR